MGRFGVKWVLFIDGMGNDDPIELNHRDIPHVTGLNLKPVDVDSHDIVVWGIMADGSLLAESSQNGASFKMSVDTIDTDHLLQILDSGYLYLDEPKSHTEPVEGPLTLDTPFTIWWSPETEEEAREWQKDAKDKGDVSWYTVDTEHYRQDGQPQMDFFINTTIGRALTYYERPDAIAQYFKEVEDAFDQINQLFKGKHGTSV
ncbi:hypothetical protein GCM10028806_33700 [Spirosoma terrae]